MSTHRGVRFPKPPPSPTPANPIVLLGLLALMLLACYIVANWNAVNRMMPFK